MNPFDQTYENQGTFIDQAYNHASAPPIPSAPAQDMMTTAPVPMQRQMTLTMNNQNQTVPNVMMDMPDEQFQQHNVQPGYVDSQQIGFAPSMQQQADTYDLNKPPFDIEDPLLRRQFFRKVILILLIQNLCAIPIIELFILCTSKPIEDTVYFSFWLLNFLVFIVMYIFSDYRRYKPVNYLALAYTTLVLGVNAGIFATAVGQFVALSSQFALVLQFLLMMAFTKQSRFKLTNLSAILMTIFINLIYVAIIGMVAPHMPDANEGFVGLFVVYSMYDMFLQLSGHHGYNLKAEEYIFGACNIYADIPNLIWRIIRYVSIDHIIRIFNFLVKCCFAEVC